MKRLPLVLLITLMLAFGAAGPAGAVTNGTLDGEGHPHVVLLLMEVNGAPAFRCSGTLLSPTVLLTAGHCTNNFPDSPYTGMRVFTESDVEAGIGITNNYPFAGPNAVEAVSWAAHPLYPTGSFVLHDVGVVILKAPGVISLLLSNNHNTGGTCFGDSGGPNFYGSGPTETKIVAGVTSFGINGNCAGTGGVFRMDRQNVLDFVQSFLP